jgi:hypothetical protein
MVKLKTNAFPITLPFDSFQVSRMPYVSSETLSKIRAQNNKTHSFFRHGDFIYCSPMIRSELPFKTETVTLSVRENTDVVSRLIEHIFFRTIIRHFPDKKPIKFYPFTVLSTRDTDDLAIEELPQALRGQISFTRQISIHLRLLETDSGLLFAFVPDIRHRWQTKLNLQHMLDAGFQLNGLPVVYSIPTPGYEDVFAPDERLIGEVINHNEQLATIRTNSGEESYPLSQLHIRMHTSDIKKYLTHVMGDRKAEQTISAIISKKKARFTPAYLLAETRALLRSLSGLHYANLDSFAFTLSAEPYSSSAGFVLEETRLCFDPTPGKVDTSPMRGLSQFGPYDSQYFTPKEPNILVLCHHSLRGRISEFLGVLEQGIPNSRFYPAGMASLLRLNKIRFTIQDVKNFLPESFEQAVDKALTRPDAPQYDVAIVVAQEEWKLYRPEINPYLRAKAKLMTAGVPVQSIKASNVLEKVGYQFLLAPIAVQMYAKCGGIPWVLPAKSDVDVELVIGIGTAIIKDNLWAAAEQSRFVGITTFFTGNGQFLLGKMMEPVRYEDYSRELLENLRTTLTRLSQEYHWEKGATVRLIFHAHKPFKNVEAEAVAQIAKLFPEYHITNAFMRIATDHPLLLLRENGGSGLHQNNQAKRGDNIRINLTTTLLQLKSPGRDIYANPVQVTLHEKSTFTDFHYLCQQIINFSQLNWRSIQPSRQPITIFYSELLAQFWHKLKQTGHWDPISLQNPKLRRSLWFL